MSLLRQRLAVKSFARLRPAAPWPCIKKAMMLIMYALGTFARL